MDELVFDMDNFKISALSKSKQINPYITNITLGPNSRVLHERAVTNIPNQVNSNEMLPNYGNTSLPGATVLNNLITDIEQQRREKVQQAVNSHMNYILEFSKRQQSCARQQFEKQQQMHVDEMQQHELSILQALEQHDKDMSLQHQQLVQYYQELAERKKKNDQELQEKEKRRLYINAIIDGIKRDQIEFRSTYQEIVNVIKNCKFQSQLRYALADISKQMKSIPEGMDEIISKCKAGRINENENKKSNELVRQVKGLLDLVKQKIAEVSEVQDNISKSEAEPTSVTSVSVGFTVTTTAAMITTSNTNSTPISSFSSVEKEPVSGELTIAPKTTDILSNTPLNKLISISSFKIYSALQENLESYTKTIKNLLYDDTFKEFRFDCKKAVNIPVNAICAVSAYHLQDKYNRLSNLLSGKVVEVGATRVNASRHPQGLAFCTNLLAKKFVLQGDILMSSNPEAAFAYAAVIIALWNEYPDFGKLVLAHFYQQCPYLIPFYPPRLKGQTNEEYYISQGYEYIDGSIEKQDKFLKRMTGIMRLYSAIVIQKPKKGHQQNPHGVADGWRWLASFLNLEPKPDITATMLHVFLENAGSTFQNIYGKTFKKMITYIYRVYLPVIKTDDSGGPVTRLELLLQNYIKQGVFETPHGILPPHFW